jgi:hypothetical protein
MKVKMLFALATLATVTLAEARSYENAAITRIDSTSGHLFIRVDGGTSSGSLPSCHTNIDERLFVIRYDSSAPESGELNRNLSIAAMTTGTRVRLVGSSFSCYSGVQTINDISLTQ